MLSERTPKPITVRHSWVEKHPYPLSTEPEERRAEFDRMILAVQAAARADQLAKVHAAIEAYRAVKEVRDGSSAV